MTKPRTDPKIRVAVMRAIADGKVKQIYSIAGKRLEAPRGIGPTAIKQIVTAGLAVEADHGDVGTLKLRCPYELTEAGKIWLIKNGRIKP